MKQRNYWTKEKCLEESLKYTSKSELYKNSPGAYFSIRKNNWFSDLCKHMICKNNKQRCIYAYEFDDNSVYIGLTHDLRNRNNRHLLSGSVFNHIKICKNYNLIQLTDYLEQTVSQIKEGEFVEKYKNEGWCILNKCKTGSLGSNILLWTKEKCQEESLKYKNRTDFKKESGSAYYSSIKNKWLDDICSHMLEIIKPDGYWNKEKCKEESLKYNTKIDFQKKSPSAYQKTRINGWLDELCCHMIQKNTKNRNYWNKEKCKSVSILCKTKTEMCKKYRSAYMASLKNNWLIEFFN